MGVVLFPCKGPYDYPYVGFFQLPVDVSNVIHSICALLLFVFLSYNIGWLFTRGSNVKKNKIYKFCSYAMIIILSIFLLLKIVGFFGLPIPGWIVMIAEALLLLFFGFAWLVKGQFVLKNL